MRLNPTKTITVADVSKSCSSLDIFPPGEITSWKLLKLLPPENVEYTPRLYCEDESEGGDTVIVSEEVSSVTQSGPAVKFSYTTEWVMLMLLDKSQVKVIEKVSVEYPDLFIVISVS